MGSVNIVIDTTDAGGMASVERPRYLTPTAPIEVPPEFILFSDDRQIATPLLDSYPEITEVSSPISTDVHAVAINPQEPEPSIIVLPYYQGGHNNDVPTTTAADIDVFASRSLPPPNAPQHFTPTPVCQQAVTESARTLCTSSSSSSMQRRRQQLGNEYYQNDETAQSQHDNKSQMLASGVAGVVVGSVLLGPTLGVIAGFYSAYATRKTGPSRDIAIALGEIALITRDKARVIDEKHHVVDQSKQAVRDAWKYAQAMDRKHHILDKLKDFAVFSWREIADFSRQNRLLERGVVGIGRGFEWVYTKLVAVKPPPAICYEDVPVLSPAQTH
jgi:hypothetical protein